MKPRTKARMVVAAMIGAQMADFAATDPHPAPGAIAMPRAPTAVDALVDSVGMGAPRPRSGPPAEFAGFRGDPAVMRYDAASGQWTPGSVHCAIGVEPKPPCDPTPVNAERIAAGIQQEAP